MKFLVRLFLFLIFLLVVVPVLFLGYLGLFPGVSSLFGSDKPRDLGIKYSETDKASARAKTKIEYATLPDNTPAEKSIQRTGSRKVKMELTSAEASALLNNRPWKYWPYQNMQIKFNSDGTAEVSGKLLIDKLAGYGAAIGAPKQAIVLIVKYLPANPVFYVKMRAELKENKVSVFDPQNFQIGKLSLPVGIFFSNAPPQLVRQAYAEDIFTALAKVRNKKDLIIAYINQRIETFNGFYAKTAKFGENKLIFDGSLPKIEATVR